MYKIKVSYAKETRICTVFNATITVCEADKGLSSDVLPNVLPEHEGKVLDVPLSDVYEAHDFIITSIRVSEVVTPYFLTLEHVEQFVDSVLEDASDRIDLIRANNFNSIELPDDKIYKF